MIDELARHAFVWLCHQQPDRTWTVAGEPLPLCARCTGVYAGAALAALALPLARYRPPRWLLWLQAAALAQMTLLGWHLVGDQPAWLRLLSGQIFATAAVHWLWLPVRTGWAGAEPRTIRAHLLAGAASIVILQAAVHIDQRAAFQLLAALALAGVALFALLVPLSLGTALGHAARSGRPDRARGKKQ